MSLAKKGGLNNLPEEFVRRQRERSVAVAYSDVDLLLKIAYRQVPDSVIQGVSESTRREVARGLYATTVSCVRATGETLSRSLTVLGVEVGKNFADEFVERYARSLTDLKGRLCRRYGIDDISRSLLIIQYMQFTTPSS
ncbi:MAG: hypothetical protein HYY37_00300 [Candidatus Aenigmarchaeota archaeon]|nr:hypothetical protein [Candidatus Aenigmarchaeota archaeon]